MEEEACCESNTNDTLFASIGQNLIKLLFRVTCGDIIRYTIVRWSVSGDTLQGKHAP